MTKINSQNKGKKGELEFVKFLKNNNIEARRGQQYEGSSLSPDVVSSLPLHWEIKRKEKINLYEAIEKADEEKADGTIPVVAHRKNHKDWLVILKASDFMKLL